MYAKRGIGRCYPEYFSKTSFLFYTEIVLKIYLIAILSKKTILKIYNDKSDILYAQEDISGISEDEDPDFDPTDYDDR